MSTIHIIPLGEQIKAVTRLIGDMKTVAAMLEGDSKAQLQTIFDMNCLIAVRETLAVNYVPGKDDAVDGIDKMGFFGPVIYGRDVVYPKRISIELVDRSGVLPRPNKHKQ